MGRRLLSGIILAVVILLNLTSCAPREPAAQIQETQTGEDQMLTNESLLISKLGLTQDRARGACEKLEEAGIPPLTKARWLMGQKGSQASVTDENGEKYRLIFGGLGFLETVMRESDGEYLYYQID